MAERTLKRKKKGEVEAETAGEKGVRCEKKKKEKEKSPGDTGPIRRKGVKKRGSTPG